MANVIVFVLSSIEFLSGLGFLFYDEKDKKVFFVSVLALLSLYDIWVMNNPLVELMISSQSLNAVLKQALLNTALVFSLVMVAGYRHI